MVVEIHNLTRQSVDIKTIRKAVIETAKLLKIKDAGVVSVALVGEKKMCSLNKIWRGKDTATDVLSFNFAEARGGRLRGGEIGEIIICLPYAKKQARALGMGADKNVAFLAAHGAIHIFNIDHERSDKELRRTEEMQRKVLKALTE